ncbi:chromosome partitioning protein ParB [Porphyromonas gingivicanis]|uniref:Chromosome partitioning protein ParB n=1 Tax=Porphyromonas gingivicanis TaxID=266762 RepID=A0A0A2G2T3_9PORP|nr:ParB/RepB/Spo0J family partition protein [Porphyromonas gingivicanis]KGN97593.1 chromosome partitioning protein ParB [Porphyromonas gingivicanis]
MKKGNSPLGRGLSAMLDDAAGSSSINEILIDCIRPNPEQPRRLFDDDSLSELATSIRNIGLVQPITVRQIAHDDYMIISGERRWRACKMAGLSTIPAYVKTADDESMMEMALIENIQREDLNAIEIALAYHRLLEATQMKQEELAERVGKNRATISNYLRLLRLPAEIQLGLTEKKIDMGHARALLSLSAPEKQLALYAQIITQKMSVREVEHQVKRLARLEEKRDKSKNNRQEQPDFSLLCDQLSKAFSTKVQLVSNQSGKGKLTIHFEGEEDLARILQLLEERH